MHRLSPCAVLIIAISGFLLVSVVGRAEAVCDGPCITLTKDQVATAAYGASLRGGALVFSIAIARAESNFQLNAINRANSNSTTDYGLWQINSIHDYDANRLLNDASYNAMAAYEISSAGTNWCPWTTFWNGDFISSLIDPARPAAQAIDNTVIRPISQEFSRVRATSDVSVRATAGGSHLRRVTAGTTGTVLDGPQVQSFETCPNGQPHYYIWWRIHWDDGGADGWSVEDALARISASLASCHAFTSGSTIPSGFGVPWNVFNPSELLLKAFCTDSSITAEVSPATYVYKQGYAWTGSIWRRTNLTCTNGALVSNAWCPNSASANIRANATHYIAYTCQRINNEWKCGCRDSQCDQSYWQLQKIRR